tara:strand:+ start:15 stop:215 length:201 start_codon:yes stop_codon:yes gene_type:complete
MEFSDLPLVGERLYIRGLGVEGAILIRLFAFVQLGIRGGIEPLSESGGNTCLKIDRRAGENVILIE